MQYVVNVGFEWYHQETDCVKIFHLFWGHCQTDTNNMDDMIWCLNDIIQYYVVDQLMQYVVNVGYEWYHL